MATAKHPSMATFGEYLILRRLARGAMAEILLAVHRGPAHLEKVVVLKRVLPELCADDSFIKRFLAEARLVSALDHPNIGRILDFGEISGQYYLTLEYLPGEDLASVIQQCLRTHRLPPIEAAVEILVGACEGLNYAHRFADHSGLSSKIVHRDVSPSNIVVNYSGEVKVIDFGMARAETPPIAAAGVKLRGRVQYMSPEHATGGKVDPRSDIFSLGIVLHEILTTQRLFKKRTEAETLEALLRGPVGAPSQWRAEIPPDLDAICLRALARDPDRRYESAADLGRDLIRFLEKRWCVRGAPAIAAFMDDVFSAERRQKKVRVSQGIFGLDDEWDRGRSWSGDTFGGLTPIRTDPRLKRPGASQTLSFEEAAKPAPPRPLAPSPKAPGPADESFDEGPTVIADSFPPRKEAAVVKPRAPESPPSVIVDLEPPTFEPRTPTVPTWLRAPVPSLSNPLAAPVTSTPPQAQPRPDPSTRAGADLPAEEEFFGSRKSVSPSVKAAGVVGLAAVSFAAGALFFQRQMPDPPPVAPAPAAVEPLPKPSPGPPPSGGRAPVKVGGLQLAPLPPGAKVFIDGAVVPNPAAIQYLTAGHHELQVTSAGYASTTLQVELPPGEILPVEVALEKVPVVKGTLEVMCQPWCEIEVDGRNSGKISPSRLSLPIGPHRLRLVNPRLGVLKDVEVLIEAGQTHREIVELAP